MSIPFYRNTPFFKSIRLISTPSKKHQISLKSLSLLNKTLKASILILSTNKGIITHHDALKFKVGGLALCVVH
jgi:ribosomal protein S8